MSRLSIGAREKMAAALVKHRFADDAEKLVRESRDLFNAVLDDQYDEATRKLMAQIVKKHRGAFSKADQIAVNVAGRRVTVGKQRLGYDVCRWPVEVEKRPLLQGELGWSAIAYLDGPIAERLTKFADDDQSFSSRVEAAYNKARGALAQFTTGKKLAADWPEAMPVIGHLIPESDRTVPVVQVAALNAEFDLPPEERLAA